MSSIGSTALSELLSRLKMNKHDTEASEELVRRYADVIRGLAAEYAGSPAVDFDEAEEVGRIALLDCAESFDESRAGFKTYARTCIRSRLVDYARSQTRAGQGEPEPDDAALAEVPSPENLEADLVNRESRKEALRRAKELLSELQYSVLCLTMEGFSVGEIARRLGVAAKAVENAKYRTSRNEQIREIFSDLSKS